MSLIEALGLVLTIFGGILFLRKRVEVSDESKGTGVRYSEPLSGPSDMDIQRFSGGNDEGVDDEIY
jgi:hypothetical protein